MYKDYIDVETNVKEIQKAYATINGPESIMFDITQRCNLHCKHCYNCSNINFKEDLDDDSMIEIAKKIVDIKPRTVCLCGGEPTIRFELCLKVAKLLSDNKILVNMVTNGYKSDIDSLCALYKHGINSIQISLDSYYPDTMNEFRESTIAHKNAIRAINNILELGNMPSVTFIPTKMNYKEMPLVAEYLYNIGIKELRYMPFIPIGRGKYNNFKLKLSTEEREELFWLLRKKKQEIPEFKFDYGDPLEHIYLFRNNYEAFNPSYEIKSNGDILLTCYLPYKFGNALKYDLDYLWDRGLNNIWKNGYFHELVLKINDLYDIEKQEIMPYMGKEIELFKKE